MATCVSRGINVDPCPDCSDLSPAAQRGRASVEAERAVRYRVNVSVSTKGQHTWDCTVDGAGLTMEEVLERSDRLVAQLSHRYPPSADQK